MHELRRWMRSAAPARNRLAFCAGMLACLALTALPPSLARAQLGTEIGEQALTAPWIAHNAALVAAQRTASPPIDGAARDRRIDRLTLAQVAIGEFESQVDELIERVGFDTQFGYVAAETSLALSRKLSEIDSALDALYADVGVRDRDDVHDARSKLRELAAVLEKKSPFERDVVNALGSGVRQTRVDLATRWWKGEEAAGQVKEVLARWREHLDK